MTIENVLSNINKPTNVIICGSFFIMREVFEALNIPLEKDPFELNERLNMKK